MAIYEVDIKFLAQNKGEEGCRFVIPICKQNAPFIQEMMDKNYWGAFMEDGQPTYRKAKILQEWDVYSKIPIPPHLLEPAHTRSLEKGM